MNQSAEHPETQPDERLAKALLPAAESLRLHRQYRGKVQMALKCPIRGFDDFSYWYTPGVAAPCREIQADRSLSYEYTNRGNTIAIVSDGTRVLGLGDIGPEAGMPVMEGKSLLFKYLGGVDAVPLCLDTKDPDELVRTVELLAPSFGGVNLEDIAQPKCFRVLDRLRASLSIPVWHDDQQGTATVVVAALWNALQVVGKRPEQVRIALIGVGAANVATFRLLCASGFAAGGIRACDRQGCLHRGRTDLDQMRDTFVDKWRICESSNEEGVTDGIEAALRGADVCIAFSSSGPGVIRPEWIKGMARDAIVFACANPVPEIWPWEAREAGARIVATGRGDFPNQVNNSLVFPGLFRGTLDVRARRISDEMALAAARALSAAAAADGRLSEEHIVPRMDQWQTAPQIAAAVGLQAQAQGLASLVKSRDQLVEEATRAIQSARAVSPQAVEQASSLLRSP
ncbi:MAG: NADP-dependent malic enzyme [Pirellulales bacterium]